MCLVAVAIDRQRRFPLVIAANRDEFRDRPARPLEWWSPGDGGAEILGGRDMQAGGTWLGLTRAGRLALLTNVRDPARHDPDAPSRGSIVPLWLAGNLSMDKFWMRVALSGHNGFNLIAADFTRGECFSATNHGALPQRLERGLWGLSNAGLDTPWPKVQALKQRVDAALTAATDLDALVARLFDALADRNVATDAALPATGVPREWERALSAAFIDMPEVRYGTRCSTVLVTERLAGKRLVTRVFERSFDDASVPPMLRHVELPDWPPPAASARHSERTIST